MKINIIKLKQFIKDWIGKGNEKQDTSKFWLEFLEALGVMNPMRLTDFEKPVVVDGNQKYIDVYMGEVKVLVEQKSLGISLNASELQSDGVFLTPYQQAKRYFDNLPMDQKPYKIITCNFEEFRIYDMNVMEPEKSFISVKLENLVKESYLFDFLTAFSEEEVKREEEISVKAGQYIKNLYDTFFEQYDEDDPDTARNLNILCVRLVFLFYCEDADIFQKNQFLDYLKASDEAHIRDDMIRLFQVLNTKPVDRSKYLSGSLAKFPYCNGGLFAEEIEIPSITQELLNMMIDASESFDWSDISPTIFGACFESTLNPLTRRTGGMHYTSVENIHKVIDPLFLDDLKKELSDVIAEPIPKTKKIKLDQFQNKISHLKFLDPACGSGNFLTETYLCLRRLENTVIKEKINLQKKVTEGQIIMGEAFDPIKVSIQQMYGIEINDFACSVAMTALWIAEAQMMKETESIVAMHLDFLPLETLTNIHEGNALRINWEDIVSKYDLNYIMGNPPFSGARWMGESQKLDLMNVFNGWKNAGNLDYVACWFKMATDFMRDSVVKAAFVSTNSLCQGESVSNLWKPLFTKGIHIDFAYKSFVWINEAADMAAVHCVIVGFSVCNSHKTKLLFDKDEATIANNINGYLIDAPNIFVESRNKPLCNAPEIGIGNKPIDDGNYLFEKDEMEEFILKEPLSEPFFRPWYGAREFINRKPRYCLYLGDCNPSDLRKMPHCLERVNAVRQFRLASKSPGTRKIADTPTRFHVTNIPDDSYIVVPQVSSERRKYIPMGYMDNSVLCSDKVRLMPEGSLYHFGVLESNIHNAWMRAICGRLKSDYSYTVNHVYNNFPWPKPTEEQRAKIEKTAQGILDARALYPDASLADLYDELTMPIELRKAHQANDRAVMDAYGIGPKDPEFHDEAACVAMLMKMYQKLTEE